jgi:hypothetical protein
MIKIIQNIEQNLKEARKYFPKSYLNNFTSKESIIARYVISKEIEKQF